MEVDVGEEVALDVVEGRHVGLLAGAHHGADDGGLLAVDVLGLDRLEGLERLGEVSLAVLDGGCKRGGTLMLVSYFV